MNVLIVGSGGREHTLAWKLKQSPQVEKVLIAPGNGGTAALGENIPVKAEDALAILNTAREKSIDLTVIGPEASLEAGVVDVLSGEGFLAFGPTQKAAELETSKAFAKDFMARHGIPTAAYRTFSVYEEALAYVRSLNAPPVLKADGLAAGKGVIVCKSKEEAEAALKKMMVDKQFGSAGDTVVVEERLRGQEVSLLAFSDGERIAPLVPAQDHKAIFDGDEGPNTGGMGAYAPASIMTEAIRQEAIERVLEPAVAGMRAEGRIYRGVLYAGLILTENGLNVLEFNCRFGDPEVQVLLPLLEGDLAQMLVDCVRGKLKPEQVRWDDSACVCVVMASQGYPGQYKTGYPISGIEEAESHGCLVFHAGTRLENGNIVTSGGRVLGVTAVAPTLPAAIERVYRGVRDISFANAYYRSDIGAKGLAAYA